MDRPLTGIRVIDAVDGPMQTVGRILSDLGAEVLRIEPPTGSPARSAGVLHGDRSLTFDLRNAGKQSIVVDLTTADGRRTLRDLAADADLVIRDGVAHADLASSTLRERNPLLVVLDISDFGSFGDRAGWSATPDVHAAVSTVLSRSGLPDVEEPLLPPELLLYESAAVQAVWTAMLELAHVRATGVGDVADFSVSEGLLQILDPVFGVSGSARAGVALTDLPRGRPDARHYYPMFAAVDGMVRICVLSRRQWRGMFEWLGSPPEFADPEFDKVTSRYRAKDRLYPAIAAMFATLSVDDAVEQGQRFGVPTAGLASSREVLAQRAFSENGSFEPCTVGDQPALRHSGWYEIDDTRIGAKAGAPELGAGSASNSRTGVPIADDARPGRRPFDGLRVLDLGVIVVGAELGRLFGDYGAEVIKIESSAFPDGSRVIPRHAPITESASWGFRNRKSLGLNLRSDEGRRIFADLVRTSDVVLTNFKPGTLAKLGFDMDALLDLNPGIILSESSAFGNHGPWSRRLGYGPLVRASAGLSGLWSYPGESDGYSDAITVFPDHLVARLNASAIVALLMRRDRTGRGGRVSTAQVDAIFAAMADHLLAQSLDAERELRPEGNDRGIDAFRGLYPAAGTDEWLVVDAVGDDQFAAVASLIGRSEMRADPRYATAQSRWENRAELRKVLSEWTSTRTPFDAAAHLQAAGVPAGPMMRIPDIEADPHLRGRGVFGELIQPQLAGGLITNLGEARTQNLRPPLLQPAPLIAEHTRGVLRDVLGSTDDEIARLIELSVLEDDVQAAKPAVKG
ncbi:CoA transferase [Gordonia sp. TBRC 11910]|uniref:CoA transferase n=1 Tax=Gordonia asplenii TaxID=2725283 RepID=A0A848L385_9ACTN|nr:CoA transferase [Gordonia asplenii]